MNRLIVFTVLAALTLPCLAPAQDEAESGPEVSLYEKIQKATELIKTSREAREAGIPEEEVTEVLEGARERGLSAEETQEVLAESTAAVEESGPVDNFGAFVQAKLDEGLRGKELATAIHEEHKKHGKGKGHGKHKGKKEKHQAHGNDHEGHQHGDGEDDQDDDQDDGHGHGHDHDKSDKKEKGKK